jgi:hypothetical protein
VGGVLGEPGWTPPAGMRWRGRELVAEHPGRGVLRGVMVRTDEGGRAPGAAVVIEIVAAGEGTGRLSPGAVLSLARQQAAAEEWGEVRARLGQRVLVDWSMDLAREVTALQLQAALMEEDPEEVVRRFEDLRGVAPDSSLKLREVAAVARAYAAVGRPKRSRDIWRAGLGAAFLTEAAVARQVEQAVGLLSSLQIMRRLTQRYPDVPLVEEARFLLPQRVAEVAAGPLPPGLAALGIDAIDLRLTAASWDRVFLARYPDSSHHAESGFHLVENLLRLKAHRQASAWAKLLSERHPDSPLLDGLLYMEGIAASELGEDRRALSLFERVAEGSFTDESGRSGPAQSRTVARYAAARLREARGDLAGAREGYAAVASESAEARQALWALSRVLLEPAPLLIARPGETPKLPVVAANIAEVDMRIYQLDLRTVFLRDAGLSGVQDIAVAGVSPVWSGQRALSSAPHPREIKLPIPVTEPGAWLVQLSGGGQESAALVVVSDLDVRVDDVDGQRRLSIRRGDAPAAGASVRAVSGGRVSATQADLRGVAAVPWGAAVLVVDGAHYGFSEQSAPQNVPYSPAPRTNPEDNLLDGIQERNQKQRSSSRQSYEQLYEMEAADEINTNLL